MNQPPAVNLEQMLHEKIPMAKLMGTRILELTPLKLKLLLPLSPNRNHKGTLFGGSLYSGAAFGCYGLFLWGLRDAGVESNDLVIADGSIQYLLPVDSDAIITAEWPDLATRTLFFESLQQKSKARIEMHAVIETPKGVCARFKGLFVAKLGSPVPKKA